MIKQFLQKKQKGISNYISLMLCIFILSAFFVGFIYLLSLFVHISSVERIHRKYLFDMERTGYMTTAMKTAMEQKLTDMGVENISLAGTSFTEVGYGNTIYLRLECDIPYSRLDSGGADFAEHQTASKHYSQELQGTALY